MKKGLFNYMIHNNNNNNNNNKFVRLLSIYLSLFWLIRSNFYFFALFWFYASVFFFTTFFTTFLGSS